MPARNRSFPCLTVMAVLQLLVWLPGSLVAQDDTQASPTNWTNPEGKAVAADFVRLSDEAVVVRLKTTGKEISIPLSSLSLESHLQALKLADPEAFSKPLMRATVKPVIEEFVPEISLSGDELLKSPFGANPTLEQFLDTAIAEATRGNSFVVWHALPPKMQVDVEELMVKAAATISPQQMLQIKTLLHSLDIIVHEKRDFILAYPDVAAHPQQAEELQKEWPKLAGLTAAFCDEAHWQKENFEKGKIIPWLANLLAAIAPYNQAAMKDALGTDTKPISYKVLSQSADTAEVELAFSFGPPNLPLHLQKVGDIWLVPAWMNRLREQVDLGQQQLAKGVNTSALGFVLIALNAAMGELARAETQEEFNRAVEQLKGLSPPPNMAAANGAPAGRGPSAPPAAAPRGRTPGAAISGSQ